MEEILKLLDDSLQYLGYKMNEKTIEIMAKSKREEAECPYCGTSSTKIHSRVKSSLSASRYLRASVADVGKSSICNMLKKGHQKRC